jgi:hypothetical protein
MAPGARQKHLDHCCVFVHDSVMQRGRVIAVGDAAGRVYVYSGQVALGRSKRQVHAHVCLLSN